MATDGLDLENMTRSELVETIRALQDDALRQRAEMQRQLAIEAEQARRIQDEKSNMVIMEYARQAQQKATQIVENAKGEAAGYAVKVADLAKQRAKDEYDNIVKQGRETAGYQAEGILADARSKADGIIEEARTKSDGIVQESKAKADSIVEEAKARAEGIVNKARKEAEHIVEEAKVDSFRIVGGARAKGDKIVHEARSRAARIVDNGREEASSEASRVIGEAMSELDQMLAVKAANGPRKARKRRSSSGRSQKAKRTASGKDAMARDAQLYNAEGDEDNDAPKPTVPLFLDEL